MRIEELYSWFSKSNGIATDSRQDCTNKIFFSLKGDNFDGNRYAYDAMTKGALISLVDNKTYEDEKKHVFFTPNTLSLLQKLANHHRRKLGTKVIALTGSTGKTTTKELIYAVLSKKYNIIATKGNLNNHIGVPLTLLTINYQTEFAVVEMGANHLKEIKNHCETVEPDFGLITNFGVAHLAGFGSIENIIKGKSELYDFLIKNKGLVFYNSNDSLQQSKLTNCKQKVSFSQEERQPLNTRLALPTNYIFNAVSSANDFICVRYKNELFSTNLIGEYNVDNLLYAITLGLYFEIDTTSIKKAISRYTPNNNRSQVIETKSIQIVLDAYNANPTSMSAALRAFSLSKIPKRKVVILGDMLELGKYSQAEHQKIVTLIGSMQDIEEVILVGSDFFQIKENETLFKSKRRLKKYKSFDALKSQFDWEDYKGCKVLIKGSRGIGLERILEELNLDT